MFLVRFLFHFSIPMEKKFLSISVHIEIESLNSSVGYLLIYKFDQCPSNFHSFFIDNQQTRNHQSLVFGLRELNSSEMVSYCSNNNSQLNPPITNQRVNFSSNYKLRVGNRTNHDQTHCLN